VLSLDVNKTPEELEAERQKELAAQEENKRQYEAAQAARLREKQQQEAAQAANPEQPPVILDKIELSLK
jgi:nitrate reductase cytochrome c-type subunit